MIKIAQLSCGTEYSGVQSEIDNAATTVGAKMVYPDVDFDEDQTFGGGVRLQAGSPQLKLMIARAMALADGHYDADAVFIASCFRCAEAALVRNELRTLHPRPHQAASGHILLHREDLKAGQLLTRMEALVTIVERKELLARERQVGLTAGIDSGSSHHQGDDHAGQRDHRQVLDADRDRCSAAARRSWRGPGRGRGQAEPSWRPSASLATVVSLIGKKFNAKLVQEELTVNSKGAVWLADRQKGEATIIDIGGMDNKAITVRDGIPDNFTMGGICAGASGRFLEMTSKRLKVEIEDLGALADRGDCTQGDHELLLLDIRHPRPGHLAGGGAAPSRTWPPRPATPWPSRSTKQQLQEIEVRQPIIQVGGTSLIIWPGHGRRGHGGVQADRAAALPVHRGGRGGAALLGIP